MYIIQFCQLCLLCLSLTVTAALQTRSSSSFSKRALTVALMDMDELVEVKIESASTPFAAETAVPSTVLMPLRTSDTAHHGATIAMQPTRMIETSRRTVPPRSDVDDSRWSASEERDHSRIRSSSSFSKSALTVALMDMDELVEVEIESASTPFAAETAVPSTVLMPPAATGEDVSTGDSSMAVAVAPSSSPSSGKRRLSRSQSSSVSGAIVQAREAPGKRVRKEKLSKIVSRGSDSIELCFDKLITLAINDKVDAVQKGLRDSGMGPDHMHKGSTTLLAWAAEYGAHRVARLLVELGADIHIRSCNYIKRGNSGYSAVIIAADKCHSSLVRLFLDHDANPNDRTDRGETAIMHAAYQGVAVCERKHLQSYLDIITMLRDSGADINARDETGSTALMFSVFPENDFGPFPNIEIFEALLKAGADINLADNGGLTVLHLVCGYQREDLAMYFARKGADQSKRDKSGRLPINLLKKPSPLTKDFLSECASRSAGGRGSRQIRSTEAVTPISSQQQQGSKSGNSGTVCL